MFGDRGSAVARKHEGQADHAPVLPAVIAAESSSAPLVPVLPAPRPDPLPVGDILRGRFELREVIGRGGLSTVYRAVDRMRVLAQAPDPEVAVKLLSATGPLASWMIGTVHREAHHLRRLAHPNIVQVFDSDQDGSLNFVVLELLRGRPLAAILKTRPDKRLPLDLALRMLDCIAAGLSHAHEYGIVHGDLKPNNIVITLDGAVKLLDFGAARALGESEAEDADAAEGSAFDAITPMYASLEMLSGAPPDRRDDVYGLGVLAYVMITGTHPFGGAPATEACRLGLRPQRPLCLSKARWRALARALAFEQRERTESIALFNKDFCKPIFWERLIN